MSTLESLRQRSGLLVTIVGLALLAFVLTGLFERGSIFGGSASNIVGEINGKSIKLDDFDAKVELAIENYKQQTGNPAISEEEKYDLIQEIWRGFFNEEVLYKEFEKLGITISGDELYDVMVENPHPYFVRRFLTNPNTNEIASVFIDPATNQLSPAKLREYVQGMAPEQETQWKQMEEYMREYLTMEKYNTLIRKGIYVTTSQAKRLFEDENNKVDVKFTMKAYQTMLDDKVKFTEDDLRDYYSRHKGEYKQEASRSIDYVAFDILPSEEDKQEVYKEIGDVVETLKQGNSYSDDSALVIARSDNPFFDEMFHTKGSLSLSIDSVMFSESPGYVFGPYMENGAIKVSKLMATKKSNDSAKVRHILIAYQGSGASAEITRTKEQAKEMADSLLTILKTKKGRARFVELVATYSDDGGKNNKPDENKKEKFVMGKDGEYGWVNAQSAFVESFKNAGLDGKKGDISVVESQFGYHIIEVLDAKGSVKKVQVATVEIKLEPSRKTRDEIYARANQFAGKYNTPELFGQGVTEANLNKRIAERIKETDRNIPGIESSRQLIKWMYENQVGTISDVRELGGRYIVALLTEAREKGYSTFEEVKNEVTEEVIKEKKAAIFVKEINDAKQGGATIEAIASKINSYASSATGVNFKQKSVSGLGNELSFIGAVSVMKAKTMSEPIVGKTGVIICYVENATSVPAPKDYMQQQKQEMSNLQMRVDYQEVFTALKENANVQEHFVKFY